MQIDDSAGRLPATLIIKLFLCDHKDLTLLQRAFAGHQTGFCVNLSDLSPQKSRIVKHVLKCFEYVLHILLKVQILMDEIVSPN